MNIIIAPPLKIKELKTPNKNEISQYITGWANLPHRQTGFADDLQVSHNSMGSLTTPSAAIVPGPKVLTWDEWVTQKTVIVRKTKRKEVVPEGQMGLGI